MPHKSRLNSISDKLYKILEWVDVRKVIAEEFRTLFISELPVVCFYFKEESVEELNKNPLYRNRRMNLTIDICQRASQEEGSGLDYWLRERAFEVEQALDNSNFLGLHYVQALRPLATVPGSISSENDEDVRVLRINYVIDYFTEITPTEGLDDFKKFIAKYDIDDDTDRFEAVDEVDIP